MKITDDKKERVKVLLDEVYELSEYTDNFSDIDIDRNGVSVYAMRGAFDASKNYEIVALTDWDKLDDKWTLDTMRALMRLEIETRRDEDDI